MKIRRPNAKDFGIGKDVFRTKDGKRYSRYTLTEKGYGKGPFRNAVLLPGGLYRLLRGKK